MAEPGRLQRFLRIEPGISLGTWFYERISNNWQTLVTAFVAGGGMTYLATITEWVRSWGPAGIGLFGLTSAVFVWVALAWAQSLRAKARLRRVQGTAIEKWKKQVDQINPLEKTFHNKRIKIGDLVHPITNAITAKQLTDCELIGPANIMMVGGGEMIGISFMGCDVAVLRKGEFPLNNVVRLENCKIYGGAICNCTIFVPPVFLDDFIKMGAIFITLTGNPTIDNPVRQEPEAKTQP